MCFFELFNILVYYFIKNAWERFSYINKSSIHSTKGVQNAHPFRFIISIPLFLFPLPAYAVALTVNCRVLHQIFGNALLHVGEGT